MSVTPYRRTHVIFDPPETVLVEPPFGVSRMSSEIGRGIEMDNSPTANVHMLSTGAWVLKPIQQDHHQIHERTINANAVVPRAHYNILAVYKSVNIQRKYTDLTGMTYDAGVAATGDPFLEKRIPANTSWNQTATHAADVTSFGQPGLPSNNAPVDRVAVGNQVYRADQPFNLRWIVPGTNAHTPDTYHTFYFGGAVPLSGGVSGGWFAICLRGDGMAYLYERRVTGTAFTWHHVDTWRYAEVHRTSCNHHTMRVWPHRDINGGGYIEFKGNVVEHSKPTLSVVGKYINSGNAPTSHLYRIKFTNPLRREVTGAGNIRRDVRRDQKVVFQDQLIRFQPSGVLTDLGISFGHYAGRTTKIVLSWVADVPVGCSLSGRLYDTSTGNELNEIIALATDNSRTYQMAYGKFTCNAKFEFESDSLQSMTPFLWKYSVTKDGVYEDADIGAWEGGVLQYLSISGAEGDLSHETASVEISDPANSMGLLSLRGMVGVQIETEYDAGNSSLRSVLTRGYVTRTATRSRSTGVKQGLGTGGHNKVYPHRFFSQRDLSIVGIWARLAETLFNGRIQLHVDPNAPIDPTFGIPPPYKVTDTVRAFLGYCGFAPSQIDVPDSAIRLWPTPDNQDDLTVEPMTSVIEYVSRILKDYLGWYLVYDGNAGGIIRARPPATAPYTNLAEFVSLYNTTTKLPHRPETYGSTNWVGEGITTFIQKDSLETWVLAPEANFVAVVGKGAELPGKEGFYRINNWAANPLSYNFYSDINGDAILSADPSHPDYLGRFVPLIILDIQLGSQEAVDWTTRRYYDVTCHALKMASFTAPLILIVDPADTLQTSPRPLRYYDPVFIDGEQWLIRNVNPTWRHDSIQMAHYEVEAPNI